MTNDDVMMMSFSSHVIPLDDQFNIPLCIDCTTAIEDWVYSKQHRKELKKQSGKNLPDLARRFIQDMYMCVYVEDSTYV